MIDFNDVTFDDLPSELIDEIIERFDAITFIHASELDKKWFQKLLALSKERVLKNFTYLINDLEQVSNGQWIKMYTTECEYFLQKFGIPRPLLFAAMRGDVKSITPISDSTLKENLYALMVVADHSLPMELNEKQRKAINNKVFLISTALNFVSDVEQDEKVENDTIVFDSQDDTLDYRTAWLTSATRGHAYAESLWSVQFDKIVVKDAFLEAAKFGNTAGISYLLSKFKIQDTLEILAEIIENRHFSVFAPIYGHFLTLEWTEGLNVECLKASELAENMFLLAASYGRKNVITECVKLENTGCEKFEQYAYLSVELIKKALAKSLLGRHNPVVKCLLNSGLYLDNLDLYRDLIHELNNDHKITSPYLLAVELNNIEFVQFLLSHPSLIVTDNMYFEMLKWAIEKKHCTLEMLKLFDLARLNQVQINVCMSLAMPQKEKYEYIWSKSTYSQSLAFDIVERGSNLLYAFKEYLRFDSQDKHVPEDRMDIEDKPSLRKTSN